MVITDFLSDKTQKNRLFDEAEGAQKLTLRRINYGMKLMNE
jgi:hypothetical protein